jgi:hypothetical protein
LRFASSIAVGVILGGCSLIRTPIGVGSDAGVPGLDAPEVPGLDAPMPDTGRPDVPIDVGVGCEDVGDRCDGDVIVRCVDGVPSRQDCNEAGAYCELGACVPRVCIPNAVTCEAAMETRCDARGQASSTTDCSRGCTPGAGCNPAPACTLSVVSQTVQIGTRYSVNPCGDGDDVVFTAASCARVSRSGPDLIARLDIATAGRFRIDLDRRFSGTDPLLYIRSACADPSSELACNDDENGGTRDARIDVDLTPGGYFLIIDTFRDDGESLEERCGEMYLEVTRL